MSASLNLLIFSHGSALTGAERGLLELVDELISDHGVACTVILPVDGPLRARLDARGATTHVVGYEWWCGVDVGAIARSATAVLDAIDRHPEFGNADVVVTNTSGIPWGAMAATYLQKPHVWYVHETGANVDFLFPIEMVHQIIAETSNAILTVSRTVRAVFDTVPDDKISVVYPHIPEPTARARFAVTAGSRRAEGPLRLIITGTITPHKGQQDAIGALRVLRAGGRNVELVIMGHGASAEVQRLADLAAREGVASHTHIEGFRDDPLDVVADADIALVCSRNTALDRVGIEAMLLETPLIMARSGGAIELCQEGAHGLLYTPGDEVDLAAKIEAVLADPAETAARVQRACAFASNTFTREGYGGAVFGTLTRLAGAANPTPRAWSAFLLESMVRMSGDRNPIR